MLRSRTVILSFVAALALLVALPASASAHETRNVGAYKVVVGWLNEPAFAGSTNAVQLDVSDALGKPVSGLDKTLALEVAAGGLAPVKLEMQESDETAGLYQAAFIPTREGGYSFHFTGTIGTTKVDETFRSGPNTFDDVQSPSAIQYPDKVPTGGDLATQIGDLRSAADQARIVAAAAVVLALVAIGASFLRRRA